MDEEMNNGPRDSRNKSLLSWEGKEHSRWRSRIAQTPRQGTFISQVCHRKLIVKAFQRRHKNPQCGISRNNYGGVLVMNMEAKNGIWEAIRRVQDWHK